MRECSTTETFFFITHDQQKHVMVAIHELRYDSEAEQPEGRGTIMWKREGKNRI